MPAFAHVGNAGVDASHHKVPRRCHLAGQVVGAQIVDPATHVGADDLARLVAQKRAHHAADDGADWPQCRAHCRTQRAARQHARQATDGAARVFVFFLARGLGVGLAAVDAGCCPHGCNSQTYQRNFGQQAFGPTQHAAALAHAAAALAATWNIDGTARRGFSSG